jgi:hypothetical protein
LGMEQDMTKDEALKLALEALEAWLPTFPSLIEKQKSAITAIKQARSAPTSADYAMGYAEGFNDGCKPAPVQEPVATVTSESGNPDVTMSWWHEPALPVGTKLYTTPPAQPAPVQEPVAWLQIGLAPFHDGDVIARTSKPKAWNPEWWRFEPLYTTPPAAPVQGLVNQRALTVDELITLEQKHRRHEDLSRAIEQRLKEKNT